MKKKQLMVAAIGVLMVAGTAFAQAPFGGPDDVAYAKALWQSLKKANLVGRPAPCLHLILDSIPTGQSCRA